MKRVIGIIGAVLLVGAMAAPALAYGPGGGRGGQMMGRWGGGPDDCPRYGNQYGGGAGAVTEEQRTQLDKLYQKFYDETASIRNDIWAKQGELNTLLNTTEPDAEKAKALQKEISDLRAKMAQKRLELKLEAGKIAPDKGWGQGYSRGYGKGYYGPHMRGYGRHMGYGSGPGMPGYGSGPGMMRGFGGPRGGYGPGACWN